MNQIGAVCGQSMEVICDVQQQQQSIADSEAAKQHAHTRVDVE